jgi:hypothetical protein
MKQSLMNRMVLTGADGDFIVPFPIAKQSKKTDLLPEIMLSSHILPAQSWRSIQTAYGGAPFFEHLAPELEALWHAHLPSSAGEEKPLSKWSWALLEWMAETCDLNIPEPAVQPNPFSVNPWDLRDKRILNGDQWTFNRYPQVFEDRHSFRPALSSLDALFVLGPHELKARLPELVHPTSTPA